MKKFESDQEKKGNILKLQKMKIFINHKSDKACTLQERINNNYNLQNFA